jgi:hypothetical protein
VKLIAALAFLVFAFAVVGYIDMLEAERLSMRGYVNERVAISDKECQ